MRTASILASLLITVASACYSTAPAPTPAPTLTPGGPAATKTACDDGDTAIASSTACLQDDAACYQLADGSWCTGGRPHGNW